jgi:transcriptional regulator with XRE-family HTH domain
MEKSDIGDRIKQIMDEVNLTSLAFADKIGVTQSTLSHIITKRNNASLDVIMKILDAYPDINYYWLLRGTGEMLSNRNEVVSSDPITYRSPNEPSLFDKAQEKAVVGSTTSVFRDSTPLQMPPEPNKSIVQQEVKFIEKPSKKITEIRIFFDDNTFQIFKCVDK